MIDNTVNLVRFYYELYLPTHNLDLIQKFILKYIIERKGIKTSEIFI